MVKQKFEKLQADETLDFHNKEIEEVALGQRCRYQAQACAYLYTSPLGTVYTNACPQGLHCVKLYGDTSYDNINWNTKVDFMRASTLLPSNKHAKQLKLWLQAYFRDPLTSESVELSFCGLDKHSEFNSKVWMTIRDTCPPGELMSYSELAQRSGYGAGASKVVGYAINKNPFMLVVGDHRVVKATGEIWCENESQRNKLRRLLVNYEIPFTGKTLDQALLEVKDRCAASKGSRTRAKPKVKSEPGVKKGRGVKKPAAKKGKSRSRKAKDDDDEDSDEEDLDDESLDED